MSVGVQEGGRRAGGIGQEGVGGQEVGGHLYGPELRLLGRGGGVDLVGELLVHHPLPGETVLQLRYPPVYPSHLVLQPSSHCTAPYYTALHCTALHCTALHRTTLHCTVMHCNTLYCITLHCSAPY